MGSADVRMGTATGRWVLVATIAGSGMAMLDATVVNVALARIGQDLDAGFTALQWIVNAYTLTLAAFILLGGVLGDTFGRRRVFLIGVVWFAVASALCAFAVTDQMLIAARAMQGVGGALLTPGSLAIISASFVKGDRGRAIGAWSGLGGIATAIGPFVGGWLVSINWRLVFFINLPLAAAIVIIALRFVPESRDDSPATKSAVDLPGAAAVVIALSGITYALTEAGQRGIDGFVVSAAVVGSVAAVVFVLVERRTERPLMRLELLQDRVFAATNVVTLLLYAALGVFFFLLVLQLQVVSGWSPIAAGTSMLPVTGLMLLLSARFGGWSERIGPRPLMALGSLLVAAGFVLALRVGPEAGYLTDVLPCVLLLGLGLSCAVAPLTAAVLAAAPDNLAGAASGVNNATARTAGLLAVAVVPVVAGLSGGEVAPAAEFDRGFAVSMMIGAALSLSAVVVSWFGVGPGKRGTPEEPTPELVPIHPAELVPIHRQNQCPINSPGLHPGDPASRATRA